MIYKMKKEKQVIEEKQIKDKNSWKIWKLDTEIEALHLGHNIKVINRKWNFLKNIFTFFGILIFIFGILLLLSYNASALGIPEDTFVVKILYQLDFSPQLKSYIDNMINKTSEKLNENNKTIEII